MHIVKGTLFIRFLNRPFDLGIHFQQCVINETHPPPCDIRAVHKYFNHPHSLTGVRLVTAEPLATCYACLPLLFQSLVKSQRWTTKTWDCSLFERQRERKPQAVTRMKQWQRPNWTQPVDQLNPRWLMNKNMRGTWYVLICSFCEVKAA